MYFTIRKNDGTGQYWWRAVADGNNQILAHSEMLNSKQACYDAITIVRGQAAEAPIYDKTTASRAA